MTLLENMSSKNLQKSNQPILQEIEPDELEHIKTLGSGAYGDVFLCKHKMHGKVAVKKVKIYGSIEKQEDCKKKFRKECKILARINNENIIKVFGTTRYADGFGLVMELAENGNLEDFLHIHKEKKSLAVKLKILQEIANALDYLHDRAEPFIHGDLKPQNVFIMADNTIKLGDFGSCSVLKGVNAMITTCSYPSKEWTTIYAAPEFLLNPNITRSPQEDVFGFAMIVYEVLTETEVYHGVDRWYLKTFICQGGRPDKKLLEKLITDDLSKLEKAIYEKLIELAIACWDQTSINRPSMCEVKKELIQLVEMLKSETSHHSDDGYKQCQKVLLANIQQENDLTVEQRITTDSSSEHVAHMDQCTTLAKCFENKNNANDTQQTTLARRPVGLLEWFSNKNNASDTQQTTLARRPVGLLEWFSNKNNASDTQQTLVSYPPLASTQQLDISEEPSISLSAHQVNRDCGQFERDQPSPVCDPFVCDTPSNFHVKIRYQSHVVDDRLVECSKSCHIFYGNESAHGATIQTSFSIPKCNESNSILSQILNNMVRGFTIKSDESGNLWVTRFCRAVLFYFSSTGCEKIERYKPHRLVCPARSARKTQPRWFHHKSDFCIYVGVKPISPRSSTPVVVEIDRCHSFVQD